MPPSKLHAGWLCLACFALLIPSLLSPSSACYHNHCTYLRPVRASVNHSLIPLQVARLLQNAQGTATRRKPGKQARSVRGNAAAAR
jgi:hypothetical protein